MTFTVQSKSQLARLLATENLSIEHQKISTAKFDPKNRVLYCPIWEDMSGALYDLLMGHEVGHALYTPAEGWHDAISELGMNFKGFLNVVEDARIEKKIKRRYPGIRSSFNKGYMNLLDRDFFGLSERDINEMSFIDRLNIFTKAGDLIHITFTSSEMEMVDEVLTCETWEDVVRITKTIFDYSKDEQFETQYSMSMEDFEFGDAYYDDLGSTDDTSENSSTLGEQNIGENSDVKESSDGAEVNGETDSGESDESEKTNKINRYKESPLFDKTSAKDNFDPVCETDQAFRENELKLVSATCKPYLYVNIPTPNLEKIVTPYNRVHSLLEDFWFRTPAEVAAGNKLLQEFKSRNDRYIGLLAKEFEMKKAARAYSKTKVATTGDIDIDKVYKYQIEDNIFRKMSKMPKGKSHGLVLLLDRSGSMEGNMAGSIEQILILMMFCRKVNIPFVVYGFGDATGGRRCDFPTEANSEYITFSQDVDELRLNRVYLREYMNSRMGNAEFNRCIRNMVRLMKSYKDSWNGIHSPRPDSEVLSSTPLSQAIVALAPLTKEFRKINNLDLVNLVIVHDGDSDSTNIYFAPPDQYSYPNDRTIKTFNIHRENVFLRQGKNTFNMKPGVDIYESVRISFFDWYKHETGAKIFGFFIAGKGSELKHGIGRRYYNEEQKLEPDPEKWSLLVKQIKKDKFIESNNPSYNGFYIIPGGSDLSVEDEELVVTGNVTASKLKTAFLKMNKKKQVNRVLVSRFIDGIAT